MAGTDAPLVVAEHESVALKRLEAAVAHEVLGHRICEKQVLVRKPSDTPIVTTVWDWYDRGATEALSLPLSWRRPDGEFVTEPDWHWKRVPHYARDVSAAWEVVAKLVERGAFVTIVAGRASGTICVVESSELSVRRQAASAPLAVCEAALEYAGKMQEVLSGCA